MADFTFINQSPVDYDTDTKTFKPTSNSDINPDFSVAISRVTGAQVNENFSFAGLTSRAVEFVSSKRPGAGQLYPRGVYNK